MQLKLTRSQRDGGIVSRSVIFCLNAQVELTAEERASVNRYKLGSQIIYNSEASKRHIEAATVAGISGNAAGFAKAAFRLAMAHLNLNISIDGLCRGQHIECKTLDELLGAEEATMTACGNLKGYLDTAATFDGRETLIDFSTGTPTVVAAASPRSLLAAPPSPGLLLASAQTPACELKTGNPADDIANAPADAGSAPLRTFATADAYEDGDSGQAIDFDALRERLSDWWMLATTGQRVMTGLGGLFVAYILFRVL